MAAYPVTDERYPPTFARRFTSLGSAVILHLDTNNSGSGPVAAPIDVNHLPSMLLVEVQTADQVLEVTDVSGTTIAMVFPDLGLYQLRFGAVSVGGSSTTVASVTVFWNQKG